MIARPLTSATLALSLALASFSWAQTAVETTTTTTNAGGIISDFSPDVITIRTEAAPEPIRYSYTTKTVYVDETGAPVTMQTVKSGLPVTVYYTKVGDRMVASKVIVKKAVVKTEAPVIEKKTTTTTTTTTDRDR